MSGIKNKVIAITGASSGIGRASALLLARAGAKLVLGARGEQRLRGVADEILANGGQVEIVTSDVRNRADLKRLVTCATERYGRLDVLISNAGIGPISALDDLKTDVWDAMIDVNLRGFLYGIAAALPVFRQQGRGHFVTIISTAGLKIAPKQAVYAATKNAVRTIMEGLRMEAGPTIRTTGISPGFVRTDFANSMTDPQIKAQIQDAMEKMAIEPDAIARAIAFAIEQPDGVEIGDMTVRPTAQG